MRNKIKLPLSEVYKLIGCGPTVMITSIHSGRPNVMTISWTTMLDFDPPVIGCVIGTQSLTRKIIEKTREFAINIPTAEMAKKVVACGSVSGRRTDKFKKFGLKTFGASKIKAPLLDECYCNIECKVTDMSMAKKYDLIIAKGVAAWIMPSKKPPATLHYESDGRFIVAKKRITVK